ncbi:MAG: phage terminase large subunit [Spirochaetia bacterium]
MSKLLYWLTESQKKAPTLSFEEFCQKYLSHAFSAAPAPYQKKIMQLIDQPTKKNASALSTYGEIYSHHHSKKIHAIVDIEPRGFGKSTRLAFAYPLYCLLIKKSRFILLLASTQKQGEKLLYDIRIELEENHCLRKDFEICRGRLWQAHQLYLDNGALILAKGAGQSIRGLKNRQFRPDLIICDDLLSDTHVHSVIRRQRIYDWLMRTVLPLAKESFFILVNTIFHPEDLPSRLLQRIENQELPGWVGLKFSAINEKAKSLWPSYWPVCVLEKKRQEIGSYAFSCEYQNNPLSKDGQVFQRHWFVYFLQQPPLNTLDICMGIDPSAGRHDLCAIVTIGKSPSGEIFVLDAWAQTCSAQALIEKIIQKFLIFNPKKIVFEDIGFQSIYREHIMREAAQKGLYLPMIGAKPGRMGKERILALSPLIENGLMIFSHHTQQLIQQLIDFPHADYDDLPDALYYAYLHLNTSHTPSPIIVSTPARRRWN